MHNDIQVIIMAGGIGGRFWPMSTPDYPKQFIDVMGVGRSLIQLTVDRLKPICPVENMWVVTNEKYISIVKEQIPDMPVDNILAEPEARNTAPCIAYACWKIQKRHPNANIVVTPSDALVINTSEYQRVLSKALSYTADKEVIVTIGIKPSRPETGYGYIAAANPTDVDEIYKVEAFKEKPDLTTAELYRQLLLERRYLRVEHRYHQPCHPHLPTQPRSHHGRNVRFLLHRQGERSGRQTLPHLRKDQHRLRCNGEVERHLHPPRRVRLERLRQLGQSPHPPPAGR